MPAKAAEGLLAVHAAVISYALSGILARGLTDESRLGSSAAVMIAAAAIAVPLAFIVDRWGALAPHLAGDLVTFGMVAYLGIVPTALATLLLVTLAVEAGATFLSLANYLVPLIGLGIGMIWLGETLTWQSGASLGLICLGIYVTGRTAPRFKNPPL